MTTPNRRPSGVPLHNLAPSGSFLQQLLEEISGSGTPAVLRNRATPQGTLRRQPVSNASRRSSSAWVGGTSIAEDARQKLRAADEARLRTIPVSGNDGAPETTRPTLRLHIPQFNAPVVPQDTRSSTPSPGDPCLPLTAFREKFTHGAGDAETDRSRPSAGLRLTIPTTQPSLGFSEATGLASPLIICDVDSDSPNTISPSEPPTSAISGTLTDATTVSDGRRGSQSRMYCSSIDALLANVARSAQEITQSFGITRIAIQKDANNDPAGGPESYKDTC